MRPPEFWKRPPNKPGAIARVLTPFAHLVTYFAKRRLAQGPWNEIAVPVICVGNINIGGTGKTPTVIALAEILKDAGEKVAVVSRGYGGSLDGPLKVNTRQHKVDQVGDEPLLIAAFCDTWIAKDRLRGAEAAIREGASIILLDDGFQNPALHKDLSIVVVDAAAGFGNGRVFPAGGLREWPVDGLKRADAMFLIGSKGDRAGFLDQWPIAHSVPIVQAELKPLDTGMEWKGGKYLAFAGIGRPEKFFATLRSLGAELIQTESLSDHQPLSTALLKRMEADAFFGGGQMVTTEKDATRLPEEFKLRVLTLPVRLRFQDKAQVQGLLASASNKRRAK